MRDEAGVPQDITLVGAIAGLRAEGFETDLWVTDEGSLRCSSCGATTPAGEVAIVRVLRLEGASDPGDEAIVLGVTCPRCGRNGVATLRYGPEAGPEDAAVLDAIDLNGIDLNGMPR